MPMKFLLRFLQAKAVVPLPKKGSKTKAPFLVVKEIKYSQTVIGLTVSKKKNPVKLFRPQLM